LAWSNLRHNIARTLISVVGVGAVVLLVFMQLGFRDSVRRTATLLYDHLDFDLLVTSREFINLGKPASLPRQRLAQASALPGVAAVEPLTTSIGLWRQRREDPSQPLPPSWNIMILAVEPDGLERVLREPVGKVVRSRQELADQAGLLGRGSVVLIDRSSRKEYGTPATWTPGTRYELNGQEVEIGGDFKLGTGFGYNGLLLTGEETLTRVSGWPRDQVTFGLVKLVAGTPPRRAQQALAAALPRDVRVWTREDINHQEEDFWLSRTAVGQFFLVGVVVALMVGAIFVYQLMAGDISKRLPEYATLRALGYRRAYLTRTVYAQGVLLALAGYLPGSLLSLVGYKLARVNARIPIEMTSDRLAFVLLATLAMCLLSATVAVRIAQRANPADLF
jgi:putative ABC transport system permease protein